MNALHFNLQCLSIRYLELELQADNIQASSDVVNLLDTIRSLHWKLDLPWEAHPWYWFLSYASGRERAKYPNRPEDTESFLTAFELLGHGMDLAKQYSVSCEFDAAERLFYLVLKKFESLDPLTTRSSTWKAELYSCYTTHLYQRRNYFDEAKFLVLALTEFIRLDSVTGPLAIQVRRRLRAVPELLEEEEIEPSVIIRPIEEQDGGSRQKSHVGRNSTMPVAMASGSPGMNNRVADKVREYELLLKRIDEVESLIGSIVAPNKNCMICLGNCLCPPDL